MLGAAALTSCREDEKLDLAGYPDTNVSLGIEGTESGVVSVPLKAVYDGEGKLSVNGELTRTYTFQLATPSPEDLILHVDPLIVNIPEDKVEIDKRELRIPAGSKSAEPVTVTYLDPDFSFAEPEKAACTYELGVKVADADGYNVALVGEGTAKVVVEKEAYVAGCSVVGANGNTVSFRRAYLDGAILNEDKMEYTFKIKLDRPADADVKVTFTSEGLAPEFAGDVTLTPAEVTVPAGSLESDEVHWTLTDDFLLTNADPGNFTVTLTAAFESADPTVKPVEAGNVLTFNIAKVFDVIDLADGIQDGWAEYDHTGWTLTGTGGSAWGLDGILDNSGDYYGYGETLSITIDMKDMKDIHGLRVQYYYSSYATKTARFETSEDGETWTEQATKEDLPTAAAHHFKFLKPVKARYLKFTSLKNAGSGHDITGMKVYGKK